MRKHIFRTYALVISLLIIFALAGCKSAENNEISRLWDEGYQCTMSSSSESKWYGIFQKEDSLEVIYKAEAVMSDEECAKLDAISYADDDADAKKEAVLRTLKNVTVTDITDKVPKQEELDSYIGKTIGDLEYDGYENMGNTNADGIYSFFYDGPEYSLTVELKEGTIIEDIDDYSANDLRELEIGNVEFAGFSFGIFE